MIPSPASRRARLAVVRTCLAAAAAAWATKLAGTSNHQERYGKVSQSRGAGAENLLDRIVTWAFLFDAQAFARWKADLDRGGLKKVWAMAALELFAIAAGLVATTAGGATRSTRLVAASLLACLAVLDPPETAVEIVFNHRAQGVALPSYRIATVAGCVVGALAEFAAAMALGWDDFDDFPAPEGGGDEVGGPGGDGVAGGDKAAIAAAVGRAPDPETAGGGLAKAASGAATSDAPPPPPTTLIPSASARGLSPLQARLESATLGFYDDNRAALTRGSWAWCAACWALTTVSLIVGAVRGGWWPTHVPLGALAAGVQGFALVLGALNARGPAWARGRAGLATMVAVQAASLISTARINRSWESTATLFGFRIVGSAPPPPGYLPFQAGAWLYLAGSVTLVGVMGVRVPRPALDAAAPRALFQRTVMLLSVAVMGVGFFTCVGTTVRHALPTAVRRERAGTAFFAIDADKLWLFYLVVVPLAMLVSPGNQASDLAHDRTLAFAVVGSLGCGVLCAYLLTPALAVGNQVGLGLIVSGFLVAATVGGIQPGGPTARAAARAAAALRSARRRRAAARRHARLGLFGGTGGGGPRSLPAGVTLLLAGDGSSGGGGGGSGTPDPADDLPAAAAAPPPPPSTSARPPDLVLDSLLGVGSFASVYRGTFRGAPVAAKCVFAPTPAAAAPARREAALGLSLKHPNVLATYAVVDAPVDAIVWPPDLPLPVGALAAGLDMALGDGEGDERGRGDSAAAAAPRLVSIVTEIADAGTLERAIKTGRLRPRGAAMVAVQAADALPPPEAALTPPQPTTIPPVPVPPSPGDVAMPAGPPPHAPTVLATLHDVAAGLAYLHTVGIVHGDLKPANVLLRSCATRDPAGRAWRALLGDFGLSRSLLVVNSDGSSGKGGASASAVAADVGADADRVSHYTNAGHGTMAYAAPELLTLGRLGPQADVYALGILMHEVWTGMSPYGLSPPAAVFYAVAVAGQRPAPDPSGAPPGYVDLMRACWSSDLRARPSAARAAKALKAMAVAAAAAEGAASALEAATAGGAAGTASGSATSTPSAGTVASWRALSRNWATGSGARASTTSTSGSSGARTASPTLQST